MSFVPFNVFNEFNEFNEFNDLQSREVIDKHVPLTFRYFVAVGGKRGLVHKPS